MLILGMDANYRLRCKLRGLLNKDPTLCPGLAYFVNNGPYADFIKDYVDQDEVSISKRSFLVKGLTTTRSELVSAFKPSSIC